MPKDRFFDELAVHQRAHARAEVPDNIIALLGWLDLEMVASETKVTRKRDFAIGCFSKGHATLRQFECVTTLCNEFCHDLEGFLQILLASS